MFKLELRFQNFTIREYSLRNGDVRFIGRGAENHIMVDDPHVSRRHARIARWGDELFVGNEVSKQGTAVNGMKAICAKLKHGDIVNIGASQNPQASFVAIEEETITDFLKATT
jgi:pSer/pThr/pTyr-binding forkhead associated (FHA) protein